MPSGAKKRKAAKKKKETGAPSNNNPGDDEVRSPDSGSEEFSTPAVDFHQTVFENSEFSTPSVDFNQTPFQVDGQGLEKTGSSSGGSFGAEGAKHVKSSKHSKNDTSCSSSSSDDESRKDVKQGEGTASFGDLASKEICKLGEIGTLGGNAVVSDVVKPVVTVSVGVTRVKEYAPIETSDPTRAVLKENGENLLAKFNELTSEVGSQTNKNGEESSNTVKFAPKDSEGKAIPSSEHTKNSDHENPEHEPLLSVDPRPVHTTSWKSCCGLFEVFTGSSR